MHEFPRDANSAFNHIDSGAVRASVAKLVARVPGLERKVRDDGSRGLLPLFENTSGLNLHEALMLGAAAAFMAGVGPDDYDAALVRQGLADRGLPTEA